MSDIRDVVSSITTKPFGVFDKKYKEYYDRIPKEFTSIRKDCGVFAETVRNAFETKDIVKHVNSCLYGRDDVSGYEVDFMFFVRFVHKIRVIVNNVQVILFHTKNTRNYPLLILQSAGQNFLDKFTNEFPVKIGFSGNITKALINKKDFGEDDALAFADCMLKKANKDKDFRYFKENPDAPVNSSKGVELINDVLEMMVDIFTADDIKENEITSGISNQIEDGLLILNDVENSTIADNTCREELGLVKFESNAKYIGKKAFFNCINLKYVNLPQAESIDEEAFFNCCSLEKINIPKLSQIKKGAFWKCTKLDGEYEFNNIESVARGAFAETAIKKLKLCGSTVTFELGALMSMRCLEVLEINAPKIVYNNMLADCGALESITIHGDVDQLVCYDSLPELKSLKVNGKIGKLDGFSSCEKLESLDINFDEKNLFIGASEASFSKSSKLSGENIPDSYFISCPRAFHDKLVENRANAITKSIQQARDLDDLQIQIDNLRKVLRGICKDDYIKKLLNDPLCFESKYLLKNSRFVSCIAKIITHIFDRLKKSKEIYESKEYNELIVKVDRNISSLKKDKTFFKDIRNRSIIKKTYKVVTDFLIEKSKKKKESEFVKYLRDSVKLFGKDDIVQAKVSLDTALNIAKIKSKDYKRILVEKLQQLLKIYSTKK